MQSRAGNALIGLLTLAVVAGLVGLVYRFGSSATEMVDVRLVFNSDISGLGRGSSVLFNGLKVGEVTDVEVEPANPRQINAIIKVNRLTPLRVDTSARLEGQGMAGIVAIQLRGGASRAADLVPEPGQRLATISAEPSENLIERVGSIAKNVDSALVGIEGAIKRNAGPISASIAEAERFTQAQAENTASLEKLMNGVKTTADFITPLPEKLQAFSSGVLDRLRFVDKDNVVRIIDDVERFSAELAESTPRVRTAIKDTASITQKFDRAAGQFEDVLKGAEVYLDAADGENGRKFFNDVIEVAKNLRVLANTVDVRSAVLAEQILRSTNWGLRGLDRITTDGQLWLARFIRTLGGVNQNPQGTIFGGRERLPQYNGSR